MAEYKVLHVNRFSFTNKNNEVVKGCKVILEDGINDDDKNKGLNIITVSADLSQWALFKEVPGLYELETKHKMRDGKAVLVLLDAAFISSSIPAYA